MNHWQERLAIISDEASESFAEAVSISLPLGIKAFELRSLEGKRFPQVSQDTITSIIETTKQHRLELLGVSPGFFKHPLDSPQTEQAFERGFSEAFRLMEQLGITQMTVFSFERRGGREAPIPEGVLEQLGRAKRRCRREGVALLIENNPAGWADTGANLAYLADKLGLQVVWDPANAAASGERAYPEGYEKVREHIHHVHFKNWVPQTGNVDLISGVVDMQAQIAALKADGYEGYYCLEPHRWHEREAATRRNAEQLHRMLSHG
ncbi:MAG: sugar phosphate isomerase/epimerase [Trueperaceae bacterium]|nr:MAG: sugar phosphate isomerase/epimerase [Trueperaceae bacterium]